MVYNTVSLKAFGYTIPAGAQRVDVLKSVAQYVPLDGLQRIATLGTGGSREYKFSAERLLSVTEAVQSGGVTTVTADNGIVTIDGSGYLAAFATGPDQAYSRFELYWPGLDYELADVVPVVRSLVKTGYLFYIFANWHVDSHPFSEHEEVFESTIRQFPLDHPNSPMAPVDVLAQGRIKDVCWLNWIPEAVLGGHEGWRNAVSGCELVEELGEGWLIGIAPEPCMTNESVDRVRDLRRFFCDLITDRATMIGGAALC